MKKEVEEGKEIWEKGRKEMKVQKEYMRRDMKK